MTHFYIITKNERKIISMDTNKLRIVEAEFLKKFIEILDIIAKLETLEEIKADIIIRKKKYKEYIEKLDIIDAETKKDIQGFLVQLLDVLDVMAQFETLEEVKADIVMRKKIYKEYIEQLSK